MISKNLENKLNLKTYLGKDRIYRPVPGAPRISKLYTWNAERNEYLVSENCKSYMARKYERDPSGKLSRKTQFFDVLDDARKWQAGIEEVSEKGTLTEVRINEKSGMRLSEVIDTWKRRSFPGLAHGTQLQYEKLLRLHFGSLLNLSVYDLTPKRVDLWLDELREKAIGNPNRKSFAHELALLSTLLGFYLDEEDDLQFHFPIKEKHWRDCVLRKKPKKPKDLPLEEFIRFREALKLGRHGMLFATLATVQYFQALRISEAAAIHREDLRLISQLHSSFLETRASKQPRSMHREKRLP